MKSQTKYQSILVAVAMAATLVGSARADQTAVAFDTTPLWGMYGGQGEFGWQFATRSNIQISALGLYDNPDIVHAGGFCGDGLLQAHPIGMRDVSNPSQPLVSSLIPAGTAAWLLKGFRYVNTSPVVLVAGHDYAIAAVYPQPVLGVMGWSTGALNNSSFVLTVGPELEFGGYCWDSSEALAFPENYVPGQLIAFGPNFIYTVVPEPLGPPPSLVIPPSTQTAEMGSVAGFWVEVTNTVPGTACQWRFNGTNALGGTNCYLELANVQPAQAGAYTVVVTNRCGAVTSAPALLSVIPPVDRRIVPALNLTGDMGSFLHVDYVNAFGPAAQWLSLSNLTLTTTPQLCFDLSEPPPAQRFYRAWQTNAPSARPVLDLRLATEIPLTGAAGSSVRVDYINQLGPTDAWVTLDTVTLTNTPQRYFDATAFGKSTRLYRLIASP
jgi:hypothetical protein